MNSEAKRAANRRWAERNRDSIREASRRSHQENREERLAAQKRWREKNAARIRANQRAHYEKNKDRIKRVERERYYRKTYGISIADYDRMLMSQGRKCRICGSDTPSRRHSNFAVDHCHATGAVRGLLCCNCNVSLGWYERHANRVGAYLSREDGSE